MSRRICVVTGTRAEFGLLKPLMHAISEASGLHLQVLVTGMHLSPEFGLTFKEIEQAGFKIDAKVEMLLSADTPSSITKSTGLGLISFADSLASLNPDIVVLLGDRFEIFAAATAALMSRIPIAHIHGGETTEGAIDEALRHSITKMSHLHFVAAHEYHRRVIQLGEHPERVFLVGGLGVDSIKRMKLLSLTELETDLEFKFGARNLLVTFHPVTLEADTSGRQITELLTVLAELDNTNVIFTLPNADMGGREVADLINSFVKARPNTRAYTSLGQLRYLSCMQFVDAVVGNSSSGLAEAPSFGIGTINIGDRQKGRLQSTSVINCEPTRESIRGAFRRLYSPEFRTELRNAVNPYGNGGAIEKIVSTLSSHSLESLLKKSFYNLPGQI